MKFGMDNLHLNIDLRSLSAFVAVAEELHFGRAARRLGMAQPQLSHQIRRLECRVGCQLLQRGTRRVELSEPGRILLSIARRVLKDLSVGLHETQRVGRGEAGRLNVGFSATIMLAGLPEVVRSFYLLYPDVDLRLTELQTTLQLDAIRTGALDVGLLRGPVDDDSLEVEPIFREPFIALVSASHSLAASRKPMSIAELAGEPFILFPRESAPNVYDYIVAMCNDKGFTPRIVQHGIEWPTIVGLVAAGLGVSVAPQCVAQFVRFGAHRRLISSPVAETHVALCWRKDNSKASLQRFTEVARSYFGRRNAVAASSLRKPSPQVAANQYDRSPS